MVPKRAGRMPASLHSCLRRSAACTCWSAGDGSAPPKAPRAHAPTHPGNAALSVAPSRKRRARKAGTLLAAANRQATVGGT